MPSLYIDTHWKVITWPTASYYNISLQHESVQQCRRGNGKFGLKKDPWPLIRVRLWGRSYRFPFQYSETRTQLFKNFWLLILVCIPLVFKKDFKIFEWVLDSLPGRYDLCFPLSLWHLTSVSCESWPILQADPPVTHISRESQSVINSLAIV